MGLRARSSCSKPICDETFENLAETSGFARFSMVFEKINWETDKESLLRIDKSMVLSWDVER